jgi:hypothetical protein
VRHDLITERASERNAAAAFPCTQVKHEDGSPDGRLAGRIFGKDSFVRRPEIKGQTEKDWMAGLNNHQPALHHTIAEQRHCAGPNSTNSFARVHGFPTAP